MAGQRLRLIDVVQLLDDLYRPRIGMSDLTLCCVASFRLIALVPRGLPGYPEFDFSDIT